MEIIAETKNYHAKIRPEKNRVYVRLAGLWTEDIANEYTGVCDKLLSMVKDGGFTAIVDLSELKAPDQKVLKIIGSTQLAFKQKGLQKTAEIVPKSTIANLSINQIKKENELDLNLRRKFSDYGEAEDWLD